MAPQRKRKIRKTDKVNENNQLESIPANGKRRIKRRNRGMSVPATGRWVRPARFKTRTTRRIITDKQNQNDLIPEPSSPFPEPPPKGKQNKNRYE